MIVLDTNVVSELMKPQPEVKVLDWLRQFDQGMLATTSITVTEIEFGLQRLPDGKRKTQLYTHFETYLNALKILPLDDIAARFAGRFWAMRHSAGFTAQSPDMMIAGIAAAASSTLATRNVRDFEHLPINVTDPWHAH
jgi:toxin FitB